jgi:hypothetical protein
MKNFLATSLLLLIFCVPGPGFAQQAGRLSGTVLDEKGAPIAYANVAVLQANDKRLVTGAVTEANGMFSMSSPAAGTYYLRLSAIGFADYTTLPFEVSGYDFSKNFGNLPLKEDIETLSEVTVQALRPTITQEADRMVVSVEGTALAAGSTAYEVLAKSPGVYIDQDGNVQLNGKTGVTIMIDGRLTYLSAKDLRSLLEGMSAENIRNIEIITNPSAKYDAEGSSGILNINLKKNDQRGMNGSVYGSYSYNRLHTYAGGGNINYKSGKWNSFLNVDLAQRARGRDGTFTRVFVSSEGNTYFDQKADEEVIRKAPSVRFGADYSLNERHSLGFMANIAMQEASYDFLTNTYIGPSPGQPILHIDARNFTASRYTNYTTNLHYSGKFDTLGTVLTADLDYVRIVDKTHARFNNFYDTLFSSRPVSRDFLLSENPSGYDIYAAKIDLVRPLPQGRRLELGAKASRVISDNNLRFYFNNTETPLPDPNRTNHFIYKENIFAGYVNLSTKVGRRINAQGGLRAEQTLSEGTSLTTGQVTERRYLNVFPSLFVQQKVNEAYELGYTYSRRIQRPNYEQLNPFIFYLDPFTWVQGNPYLRPQYTHSLGITQTFKQSYRLMLEYQLTKDFIGEVPTQYVETSTTVFNRDNVDDAKNISATAIVPIKIMKNWDTNNTLVAAYQEYSSLINNELVINNQLFYMIQSNHNLLLPLNMRLEVNTGYQGPVVWGLYRIEKQWWVNLGLKKSFMDDRIDLSLTANDIFKGQRVVGGADIGGNINQFNQYFLNRSIGLNLRYRFSKGEQFDARRRNINLEELDRTGG